MKLSYFLALSSALSSSGVYTMDTSDISLGQRFLGSFSSMGRSLSTEGNRLSKIAMATSHGDYTPLLREISCMMIHRLAAQDHHFFQDTTDPLQLLLQIAQDQSAPLVRTLLLNGQSSASTSIFRLLCKKIGIQNLPMGNIIISVSDNNIIHDLLLSKINELIATMLRQFIQPVSSSRIARVAEPLPIEDYPPSAISTEAASVSVASERDDAQRAGSKIWEYMQPYVAYRLHEAIHNLYSTSKQELGRFILSKTMHHPAVYGLLSGIAGGLIIKSSFLGIAGIGALGSVAVPAVDTISGRLSFNLDRAFLNQVSSVIPYSRAELAHYNLKENPSPLMADLFASYYQERTRVRENSLTQGFIEDLSKIRGGHYVARFLNAGLSSVSTAAAQIEAPQAVSTKKQLSDEEREKRALKRYYLMKKNQHLLTAEEKKDFDECREKQLFFGTIKKDEKYNVLEIEDEIQFADYTADHFLTYVTGNDPSIFPIQDSARAQYEIARSILNLSKDDQGVVDVLTFSTSPAVLSGYLTRFKEANPDDFSIDQFLDETIEKHEDNTFQEYAVAHRESFGQLEQISLTDGMTKREVMSMHQKLKPSILQGILKNRQIDESAQLQADQMETITRYYKELMLENITQYFLTHRFETAVFLGYLKNISRNGVFTKEEMSSVITKINAFQKDDAKPLTEGTPSITETHIYEGMSPDLFAVSQFSHFVRENFKERDLAQLTQDDLRALIPVIKKEQDRFLMEEGELEYSTKYQRELEQIALTNFKGRLFYSTGDLIQKLKAKNAEIFSK